MTGSFLAKVVGCLGLMAVTMAIHVVGLVVALRWVVRSPALAAARVPRTVWLMTRVVWILVMLHTLEIAVWAAFYWWRGALPDLDAAFYFSGVTYTTIGYGDVVLPDAWRNLGPLEGLTGILMSGLSTGFFFAVLSRIHWPELRRGGQAGAGLPPSVSSIASATEMWRPK